VPSQSGRTVVVTGASSGLGLVTACVLARRAATVILAGRDLARARQAANRIRAGAPEADVRVLRLDLAALARCYVRFAATHRPLFEVLYEPASIRPAIRRSRRPPAPPKRP